MNNIGEFVFYVAVVFFKLMNIVVAFEVFPFIEALNIREYYLFFIIKMMKYLMLISSCL